jgi:hypothetical protein
MLPETRILFPLAPDFLLCDFPLSHLESASLRTVKKSQLGFNFGNFGIYGNFGNRRQVTDYSIRPQPEARLTSVS